MQADTIAQTTFFMLSGKKLFGKLLYRFGSDNSIAPGAILLSMVHVRTYSAMRLRHKIVHVRGNFP